MSDKKRLDDWLVELNLAPSKTKAKDLITEGSVSVSGRVTLKPGSSWALEDLDSLKVTSEDTLKYVSRGGLKLEAALDQLGLSVKGLSALDIGSSTGGFSDCLLQRGVKSLVGFDVGRDQIHSRLLEYKNFKNFQKVHFEKAEEIPELSDGLAKKFDFIVGDLSFVSVGKVFPFVWRWLKANGQALLLVKPQFELEAGKLNKKGVVKDMQSYPLVEEKIITLAKQNHFEVVSYRESSLKGKDGNLEFFILLRHLNKEI